MLTFRDQLDHASQDRPVALFPRCHPEAALRLEYGQGVLTVLCADCRQIVEQLAIAPSPPVWEGNGQSRPAPAASCCDGTERRPVT